ncbi:MAG: ATP-binding protein, partial [Actinomycetota bacterium]|nr:ATP-binding protein [Actinomycetota bacterium]
VLGQHRVGMSLSQVVKQESGGARRRSLTRLGATGRVWAFTAFLAGLATATYFGVVRGFDTAPAPFRIQWWLLALMFLVAEILVVYVDFRRNAYSFSLSEIPLVIGLFMATPGDLILAQLVGSLIALAVHRRQSLFKVAFNLSHFALETTIALSVFNLFGLADPLDPVSWGAAVVAALLMAMFADVAIGIAVSLAERRWQLQSIVQGLAFGKIVSITNASIGLIGVMVVATRPVGAWLLAVPALILFFAYRVYTSQREQHERMEQLYESTHLLSRSLKMQSAVLTVLSQAREMFRAQIAEILLFPETEDDPALRTTFGPDDHEELMAEVHLDPTEGVWARVASEGQPVLLPRPIQNERLRVYFEARGIRDLMVAPLQGADGVVGTILVANRESDIGTFDVEDLKLFEALTNHANVALENARLVQELEGSLEELTLSSQMKDDFVATVSHELRTPLTAIQGSVKTLLQAEVAYDEETQQMLLEAVDRQSERLRRLIEDLLVAARIESRGLHAIVSPVSLGSVMRQVVEGLGARIDTHDIRLVTEDEPGLIRTDEQRIEQIVSNLMDNALKYSPAGSTVTVTVRRARNGAEIAVADEGPGVPEELRDKIFERFYQADQTSTRAVGGTGLGLWICQRLTEVIGGTLSVSSPDRGGSTFTLWVPGRPPADAISATEAPAETLDLIAAQRG